MITIPSLQLKKFFFITVFGLANDKEKRRLKKNELDEEKEHIQNIQEKFFWKDWWKKI